jgi:hypothetical protein
MPRDILADEAVREIIIRMLLEARQIIKKNLL